MEQEKLIAEQASPSLLGVNRQDIVDALSSYTAARNSLVMAVLALEKTGKFGGTIVATKEAIGDLIATERKLEQLIVG